MSELKCPECGETNLTSAPACRRCGVPFVSSSDPEPQRPKRPNAVTLQPGQVVANRYRVIALIGRGGMGAIYRVHDNVLNEQVALKTLLPQFAQDRTIVERFYNEARIARQLSHPNIVRVHDIGMAGSIMYISMEYLDGKSVRACLEEAARGTGLTVRQKLMILEQLCNALEYAHRYTVHRDIKPENVMITKDGTVKLMDFGISKLVTHTRLTMTSMVMGTPQYMSPEQFRDSGNVDARADIYSLGVLLYELFTGELPTAAAKPASKVAIGVPEALDPVVAKCLEGDPAKRFQTAQELRAALREVARTIEKTEGPAERPAVPPRRAGSTVRLLLKAAAVVMIAVAAGLIAWKLAAPASGSDDASGGPGGVGGRQDDPLTTAVSLFEKARAAAEKNLRDSEERRRVLAYADELARTARSEAIDMETRIENMRYALQCCAGLVLWQDDSVVFVPPGRATFEDASGAPRWVPVDGFFVDRRPVSNRAFADFARSVPKGWSMPAYLAMGNLEEAVLDKPILGAPFYSAQAFAASRNCKVPTEAQWVRAAIVATDGGLNIEGLFGGPREWTRTVYTDMPYPGDQDPDDPSLPYFGVPMVVRGGNQAGDPAGNARARYAVPFETASFDITFRCVSELPSSMNELTVVLR